MDWMLGSCSGHHRLWPLTPPLFRWRHQSDCFIWAMSPLFTQWQFGSPPVTLGLSLEPTQLAGTHFHSSTTLIMERFDGKLLRYHCGHGLYRTRRWNPKKLLLCKGNLPRNVSKALLTTPPLYNFCKQSEFVFWLFSWLLCPLSWWGKEVCDCLWELNGWRTYWHGYCRIKPSAIPALMTPSLPLSSLSLVFNFLSSSTMEEREQQL